MTTRPRGANLEQESTDIEEGAGELSVEEKYVEVKQLIALGKEKGFLLYDEIYEILPEEVTSLPEELDEIYIRFNDLGIDVVEDAEKQLAPPTGKGTMTIDGTIEEKEMDQREEVQADIIAASSGIVDKTNDPVRMYLREMGTVKLLDRQGEVDIAKRIEKGERKVYKALSQNRIILDERGRAASGIGDRMREVERIGEHAGIAKVVSGGDRRRICHGESRKQRMAVDQRDTLTGQRRQVWRRCIIDHA